MFNRPWKGLFHTFVTHKKEQPRLELGVDEGKNAKKSNVVDSFDFCGSIVLWRV